MSIGSFPKVLYKGDSLNTYFYIKDEAGDNYNFKVGDILNLGIKEHYEDEDYIVYRSYEITDEGEAIQLILTADDTKDIPEERYAILEVELITDNGDTIKTVYQDKIYLKGVIVDE